MNDDSFLSAPQLKRDPLGVHDFPDNTMRSRQKDHELERLRRTRAEERRVGVSSSELQAIVRARFEEYVRDHPELRARIEKDPDYDPNSISMIYSCELALEALASLPDGAGTAAYVERLDALHRERGWALPGWRRPNA